MTHLRPRVGRHKNFLTNVEYEFTEDDWRTFSGVKPGLELERRVLFEKDDDVLNHELTLNRYEGHRLIRAFDGNSHRFSFWKEVLPEIRKLYDSRANCHR